MQTLEDYRDALVPPVNTYTHQALTPDGHSFSIHKDEESATVAATRIGGTVAPYTPNPTTYWNNSIGDRYDH